jgi:RimJ/RimL family protein N-acetyltransferase
LNRRAETEGLAFGFETERLRMRPLQASDETLFLDLYTDADTMRFIGKPLSPERARRSFCRILASASQSPPGRVFLAVTDKATQDPLGICAIVQFNAARTRAEVGMMLMRKARARGYSKECLSWLVTMTFAMFPIGEVWVQYSPGHSVAERLVVSIGFWPGAAVEPSDGSPAQRVWSIHRPSWGSTNAINNQGEDNVERHRFS